MLFDHPRVSPTEFEARSGWRLQPQGLCHEDVCVPLPASAVRDGELDLREVATALGSPLVADDDASLFALGPRIAARALASAQAPDLVLPDVHGRPFALRELRGKKVLLLAWASW